MTVSIDKKTNGIALKLFEQMMYAWQVDSADRLLILGSVLTKKPILSMNELERISYLLDINKSLQTIFSSIKQANGWLKRENSHFEGLSALQFVLLDVDKNLPIVSLYLKGQN
jgi:hypothetical protein